MNAGDDEKRELVRKALEDRGWTGADLARATGLSYPHVSNLIRGARPISDEAGETIALVLGLSPERLSRRPVFRVIAFGSTTTGSRLMPHGDTLLGWYTLEIEIPGIAPGHLVHVVPSSSWAPGRYLVIQYPDGARRLRRAVERDGQRWIVDEIGDESPLSEQRHQIVGKVTHELRAHDEP